MVKNSTFYNFTTCCFHLVKFLLIAKFNWVILLESINKLRCHLFEHNLKSMSLFSSGCGDGRLAGSMGRELWLLLLLEYSDQRGVLGTAKLFS